VVTPVYNGGDYLEAAMRCVQQQTYDRLVHVVVDNCSSDNTSEIIDRFRSQRVELVTLRNDSVLPQRENWNKAMSAAPVEASYVKVLCADDLMRSDCIERFVKLAQCDEKIQVVLCDDIFEDKVRRANLPSDNTVFDGIKIVGHMLDESINWLPYHHLFVRFRGHPQDAEFFRDTPVKFDLLAVMRCSLRGKLGYVHEPLVYTRWHADSISSQYLGADQLEALLECFDIMRTFGVQCWDDSVLRKKTEYMRARLLRFAIKWAVMGRWDTAREIVRGLRDRQVAPSVLSWIKSILDWIPYRNWKRSWQLPSGSRIDEAEFLRISSAIASDVHRGVH
jgi:glycosyltransferase involved in cell wall biosynthesis